MSEDMIKAALNYIAAGHRVALATVIATWGSAPRPAGAQLAITHDGDFQGSVSGGCVEGAVIMEAKEALADGKSRILEYGVADEDAFAVGLACGGDIRILVEPIGGEGPTVAMMQELAAARQDRRPVGYRVDLTTQTRTLIDPADAPARFVSDKSGLDGDVFTAIHNPSLRLIIVGAVHIAQALAPMARQTGYGVVLIDPRDSFGSAARFPDDVFQDGWPDEAMLALAPDARTAVVTLTHDPKLDTPALAEALKSEAFYIGALGSKKTHAKRVAALTELGFTANDISRIYGPVGANIAAKTPAEIAVAILAQITERLRRPDSRL